MMKSALVLAATISLFHASAAYSQTRSPPVLSAPAAKSYNSVAAVIKAYGRSEIERSAGANQYNRRYVPTSRDRFDHPLASRAHNVNGAVDYGAPLARPVAIPQMKRDAQNISRDLGPHYRAVVEEKVRVVSPPGQAQTKDRWTTYQAGYEGRTRTEPSRATGNHIHVQPNYGIRPINIP